MPHSYPMMLDVTDRLVVIVGGGWVAVRKANGLLGCGATRLRCVSPAFHPDLPAQVVRVHERYSAKHLDGADLVFAATDDVTVNADVVRDARARGILANRADSDTDPAGDFSTPALFRSGAATVTVSAGSPALAAMIRDGLRERWDERWSRMADVMQQLRPIIVARKELSDAQRRAIFHDLATPEALDVLAEGGVEALRGWLTRRFPEIGEHYA